MTSNLLTPVMKGLSKRLLQQETKKQISLLEYAEKVAGNWWHPAKHLEYICNKLQEATDRGEGNILICLPPQNGKSSLVSEIFPTYYLQRNPENRVMFGTYAASFAATWGRKCRAIVNEHGKEYGLEIAKDSSAALHWDLEGYRGGYMAAGVGGGFPGHKGDCIIVDDPCKDQAEARSTVAKENIWDWWRSVVLARQAPKSIIIVIATRWVEDDLIGRLLKQDGEKKNGGKWELVNLPAFAEENDLLGRQIREPLWPERFSFDFLKQQQEEQGTSWFSALYQQRPYKLEGQIIKGKWFRYFEERPTIQETNGKALHETVYVLFDNAGKEIGIVPQKKCKLYHTYDLATSQSEKADYFVEGTFAETPNKDILVINIYRDRLEAPEQMSRLKQTYNKWKAPLWIEGVAYQTALVQTAVREGLPAKAIQAKGNKETRLMTAAVKYEAGKVYHLRSGSWLNCFEDEIQKIPNGEHDDQGDVLAYGCIVPGLSKTPWVGAA